MKLNLSQINHFFAIIRSQEIIYIYSHSKSPKPSNFKPFNTNIL